MLVFLDTHLKNVSQIWNIGVISNVNMQQRLANKILNASPDFFDILMQIGDVNLTQKISFCISEFALISWLEKLEICI
jgi:hypothetical protein